MASLPGIFNAIEASIVVGDIWADICPALNRHKTVTVYKITLFIYI
jgi:hypothetical protein